MKTINLSIYKKVILAILLVAGLFAFQEAKSGPIFELHVYYGHKEMIRGKEFCVDFGICYYTIEFGMSSMVTYSASSRQSGQTPEHFSCEGDIKDGYFVLNFKSRLDKKYMYPEGKYVFPVGETKVISGKPAESLGFKKFTILKGNYEFDGQVLKIKINDAVPLERKVKLDGTITR